jgi:pimeloyl-ACP methyl ester carboxylesterase
VAHSFGAAVALQLMRLHPERVRSLVLLDGRARLLQPELRLRDWHQFERWQRHFDDAGISLDPNLELDFQLPLHIEGEAWSKAAKGLADDGFFVPTNGKRAEAKYRKLLTETTAPQDFRKDAGLSLESLRRIAQPTIVVYGSISPYLPTRDGLLREIPGCQSKSIANAGHNFPFLMPAETADVIERFWSTCRNGRMTS